VQRVWISLEVKQLDYEYIEVSPLGPESWGSGPDSTPNAVVRGPALPGYR